MREEVLLDLGFATAQARLANLAHGGSLLRVSEHAYGEATTGLARVGPLGSARGMSRLVEVRFRDLVVHDESAYLTLRWETAGPGGALFPALDADITLTPSGDQATVLVLAGVYRPPLGILGTGLDRAIMGRVAVATIRTFVSRLADAITHPASQAGSHRSIADQNLSWRPPAAEMP